MEPSARAVIRKALIAEVGDGRLDLGCVASYGHFFFDQTAARYTFRQREQAATAFPRSSDFTASVQRYRTDIDVEAYGRWLTK